MELGETYLGRRKTSRSTWTRAQKR